MQATGEKGGGGRGSWSVKRGIRSNELVGVSSFPRELAMDAGKSFESASMRMAQSGLHREFLSILGLC